MGRSEVTAENIIKAIEIVNLGQYISSVPLGLKTELDPEGKKIPRSIQNKILLARAIVNEPKLLMLEDSMDHVLADEKEQIIKRLIDKENPWSIIVTAVDPIWSKYIPYEIKVS